MSSTKPKPEVRVKVCEVCKKETSVAFRVRLSKIKEWVFVCKPCCDKSKSLPDYQYGGTWKGDKK